MSLEKDRTQTLKEKQKLEEELLDNTQKSSPPPTQKERIDKALEKLRTEDW